MYTSNHINTVVKYLSHKKGSDTLLLAKVEHVISAAASQWQGFEQIDMQTLDSTKHGNIWKHNDPIPEQSICSLFFLTVCSLIVGTCAGFDVGELFG